VYDRIRDYISRYHREDYLFLNGGGKTYSAPEVSQMIQSAAQRTGAGNAYLAERHITFHSWRHLYSTVLYESGQISSEWIEYFMGHKQRGVKAVYTHLHRVDGKDTCEKVLKVLGDRFITTEQQTNWVTKR
jgi:integrase